MCTESVNHPPHHPLHHTPPFTTPLSPEHPHPCACWDTPLLCVDGMTDACENITLLQTLFACGKNTENYFRILNQIVTLQSKLFSWSILRSVCLY